MRGVMHALWHAYTDNDLIACAHGGHDVPNANKRSQDSQPGGDFSYMLNPQKAEWRRITGTRKSGAGCSFQAIEKGEEKIVLRRGWGCTTQSSFNKTVSCASWLAGAESVQ